MKTKPQQETTLHFFKWVKFKRLSTPSVCKDMEELELSYTAGGNVNDTTTLENSMVVV